MNQKLMTFGSDRRLVLANGEALRSPAYGGDWEKIRIGLQFAMIGVSSSISGNPRMAVGVCKGPAGWGTSATELAIGVRTGGINATTALNFYAGPPNYLDYPVGSQSAGFVKTGSNVSASNNLGLGSASFRMSADPLVRLGFFVDITQNAGSGTYSIIWAGYKNVPLVDLSDAEFLQMMEVSDIASIPIINSNYGVSTIGSGNPAAVSATKPEGGFDYIFVFWERTAQQFSFNIAHRKIL